jgi:hypothetical protein
MVATALSEFGAGPNPAPANVLHKASLEGGLRPGPVALPHTEATR